jgi:allantoinase
VAFWGGLVPDNVDQLEPLREAGVAGFKCFLVPSGIDAFPPVEERVLREALAVLARLDAPLLVHAELPGPIEAAWKELAEAGADGRRYANWLFARPRAAENDAIALVLRLARESGARVHIVHLSSSGALAMVRDAKADGVRVTVETCPHYLNFASEDIRDGATELKCAPPIRERENREALWRGLADGTIDLIATDHSPCPPAMKKSDEGDFAAAWGGIASLQLALPVVWRGARQRGYTVERVADWLSAAPAELAGLTHRKGALVPGRDADIVIWDPEAEFLVRATDLQQRHRISPYDGARLPGVVRATFLRGMPVYRDGRIEGDPCGVAVRVRAF